MATERNTPTPNDDDEDFGALLDQHLPKAAPKHAGELVDATVVGIYDEDVVVSCGSKDETPVPIEEFQLPNGELTVRVGDTVRVLLTGWTDDGEMELSHKKARSAAAATMLAEAYAAGVPVRGVVVRALAKGVIVDVGAPAFMPASHVDILRVPDLSALVGREIEAAVIEFDPVQNRAVLSRRKLLAERRDTERGKFLATVEPGQVLDAVVRDVLDFGAFLTLGTGAVDGLLPRSEITYDRGTPPSELLKVGDKLQVKVLEVDADSGKVTLSRKRVGEDPWATIAEHYPVGTTVTGKVAAVQAFGAFVQLQEGITGLIHAQEISWGRGKKKVEDHFRVGDMVNCQVIEIDEEKRRLALSLRQLMRDPWQEVEARYPAGSKHKGVVTRVEDFGAFVKLDEENEGLLHIGEMSWTERPKSAADLLKEGDEVKVVILSLDGERRRISIGVKQLTASPYEKFANDHPAGTLAKGKISRLVGFGAFVELAPGLEGLIHISELDEQRVDSPERVVRLGDEVTVKVLEFAPDKKRISLSLKDAVRALERENIRQYQADTNAKGGAKLSLGDALRDAMKKGGGDA